MSHFIYCYDECRYAECRGAKDVSPLRVFQAKLIIVGLTEPLLDNPKKQASGSKCTTLLTRDISDDKILV